jgi:hypothetical protein
MTSLYHRLKMRWYRRQTARAIWFLRYTDRLIHSLGWSRPTVRQFWEDFVKHPEARNQALNQVAVINKIRIKVEKRSRLEQKFEELMAANKKVQEALYKANVQLSQHTSWGDNIGATGPSGPYDMTKVEASHEVPTV